MLTNETFKNFSPEIGNLYLVLSVLIASLLFLRLILVWVCVDFYLIVIGLQLTRAIHQP